MRKLAPRAVSFEGAEPLARPLALTKPKLSRASTHKVRSGCITCKKRHVKCDEAKPHCKTCVSRGMTCEGYVAGAKKGTPGPAVVSWDSRQVVPVASPTTQLLLDPDTTDFRTGASLLYFDEFIGLVRGSWNTATSNGDLWAVTLPQLARTNNTLRHAAIAIGALCVWHRQFPSRPLSAMSVPDLMTAEGDIHYFRSIAYYCQSLKLQSQQRSTQDAVLLSVLLLTFESLRGNIQAALDHVDHGLAMLLTFLADGDAHQAIAKLEPSHKPLFTAVADIFNHLGKQGRSIYRKRINREPNLRNFSRRLQSKKYTVETFFVLLSQIPRSSVDTSRIPAVFSNLGEYEEYWVAAQRARAVYSKIMAEVIKPSAILHCNDQGSIEKYIIYLLSHPRVKGFSEDSNKMMRALGAAFLPLFNRILASNLGSPTYLKAIHLRLQYLEIDVFEDPTQFLSIEIMQSKTSSFREYLSLAQIALRIAKQDIKNPAHHMSLQCGIAWHLLVLSLFCRDPLARDEAVWTLRDYPGQDGLWNTRALYAIALKNRDVEQLNAAEGTSTEQWRRLWRREFGFEDGGHHIMFRYLEKDETTGEWGVVEDGADIRGDSNEIRWSRQPLTEGSSGLLMVDLYVAEEAQHAKK
ncbi:hypothetical protein GGS23DRAFT_554605 [Durotheca rogersii]|uniref:uncharacterized protein n=1 Tax=Durotheca rogersii TaxID=419775 RepID=UPI00221FA1A7|nr:uncharacterized protein GGS23DRAFT_554605 [Durotheca rogersii]KAI5865921.1 hypothetical protein GGS23DRAFT_554605 [Durotheca rogersii]